MSTYVYGGRDFKGNIVSNAALQPFGSKALLDAFSPPIPTNPGQQAWVSTEKQPYWWDGAKWITVGSSGNSYYGARTGGTSMALEIDCSVTPPTNVRDQYIGDSILTVPVIDAATLAEYPEISTSHPLTVDLSVLAGFTIAKEVTAPFTEDYNRKGPLIIRATMTTAPVALATNPAFVGIWYHGWQQPAGTDTLSGKLGADWTTVAKTVETPLMRARDNGTSGAYDIDAVDTHTILVGAQDSESCHIAMYVGGVYTDLLTWQLKYDNVDGLVLIATSNTTVKSYVAMTYDDPWASCSNGYPGFIGMPIGYYTRYWF